MIGERQEILFQAVVLIVSVLRSPPCVSKLQSACMRQIMQWKKWSLGRVFYYRHVNHTLDLEMYVSVAVQGGAMRLLSRG